MAAHRINRLEIELCSDDAQRAHALSERVAGMHRGRIAPLLDRVCGELGGGASPVRLDRLEVDLGVLAADAFEAELLGELEPALRAALAAALARRPIGGEPRAGAALELLETFALTGGLPWWADPRDGAVVSHHFAQAAAEAAEELVALVRRLAVDPGALERLARVCDEAALAGRPTARPDWSGARSGPLPGPLPGPPPAAAAIRAARRRMLARLDELYVDDAGLVILWPFLGRYFTRAGLLGADGGFLDEAAQLQAVALTCALATADPDPPEPRLPLAKLLGGRPLESDFQLVRPLSAAQLAERDLLLAAVLDHAPSLGALSPEGLRAAFLQRPGALSTRDGAWLLQVERRVHDVVLDRVPWSWSWVRLPWMSDPLRVEW